MDVAGFVVVPGCAATPTSPGEGLWPTAARAGVGVADLAVVSSFVQTSTLAGRMSRGKGGPKNGSARRMEAGDWRRTLALRTEGLVVRRALGGERGTCRFTKTAVTSARELAPWVPTRTVALTLLPSARADNTLLDDTYMRVHWHLLSPIMRPKLMAMAAPQSSGISRGFECQRRLSYPARRMRR